MDFSSAFCGFQLMDKAPNNHKYIDGKPEKFSPGFTKAVRKEIKLLQTSLPIGIVVKGFEDRLDLYSCLIIGPEDTPYWNGVFLFDIKLPDRYPIEHPKIYFRCFSPKRFNPNLYEDGKVCVSLLGTFIGQQWINLSQSYMTATEIFTTIKNNSGILTNTGRRWHLRVEANELWSPESNLLQVFVSIQGLILNSEPYFNEDSFNRPAGGDTPESIEKSRRYNELAVIGNIENLCAIIENPPQCFRLHEKLISWTEGGEVCKFPLQPVSTGFKTAVKRHLDRFANLLRENNVS